MSFNEIIASILDKYKLTKMNESILLVRKCYLCVTPLRVSQFRQLDISRRMQRETAQSHRGVVTSR